NNDNVNILKGEEPDLRLELARALVGLHGGTLYAESAEGKVQSYVVFFPASHLIFDSAVEI
ncbi:MAG: hypothetical protein ABL857_07050, partial [Rickettsiales bacterium]